MAAIFDSKLALTSDSIRISAVVLPDPENMSRAVYINSTIILLSVYCTFLFYYKLHLSCLTAASNSLACRNSLAILRPEPLELRRLRCDLIQYYKILNDLT